MIMKLLFRQITIREFVDRNQMLFAVSENSVLIIPHVIVDVHSYDRKRNHGIFPAEVK